MLCGLLRNAFFPRPNCKKISITFRNHKYFGARIATLRAWYRLQNPLNPENTKKLRKNTTKSPPRVGDRKYEKITEKISKILMVIFGPFLFFFGNFFVFSGPKPGRGFCIFFVILSYFRDSEVFVICTRPAGSQGKKP